jgi:hypothetical protein
MTDHIAACAAEIVALINASPRTPRVDEIAAIIAKARAPSLSTHSPLLARAQEIYARMNSTSTLDGLEADAVIDKACEDLVALDAEIPRPPRSFADLVARAQIAFAAGEVREDGTLGEAEDGDIFEGPAARLVEDVLRFARGRCTGEGAAHTTMRPADFRPQWTSLMQQLENMSECGDARERRVAELVDAIDAVARKAGRLPARDLDDVRFLAEVAYHYQPYAESYFPTLPADTEALGADDVTLVNLLRAIADVTA